MPTDRLLRGAGQQAGCDGSRIRKATSKRNLGYLLGGAGAIVAALSFLSTKTTDTQFGPVTERSVSLPILVIGLGGMGYGGYLAFGSSADATAWEDALKAFRIGSSTPAEVVQCLGKPRATSKSTSGAEETLTYVTKSAGTVYTYTFTFSKGALTNIAQTAQ